MKNAVLIFLMLITQAFFPQSIAADTLQPDIAVAPGSINFGSVYVGTSSAPVMVTLTNTGNADLVISAITIEGTNPSQFAITGVDTSSQIIAPGESAHGWVQFNPTSSGYKIACVCIYSNDPDEGFVHIVMQGTGVCNPSLKPDIAVEPASVDFGDVLVHTGSAPRTVTVTNEGNANLIFTYYGIGGINASQFVITSINATSTTLLPGASVSGTIVFTPASVGSKSAYLRFCTNDPDENPYDVPLTGTGTDVPPVYPDIDVTPAAIDFGPIPVGSASGTENVTIANEGDDDLVLGNLIINDSQFQITSGNVSGQTLGPGASADVTLVFTPASEGSQAATLTIPSNDPDEDPVSVALSGEGTAAPDVPDIYVTPLSLDFGAVEAGSLSATQNVTVGNTGTAGLNIGNLIINDSQFSIVSGNISGQVLGPGASANVTLVFTPASEGSQAATLTIPSDDPDEDPVNVALSGEGTLLYHARISGIVFDDMDSDGFKDPGEPGLAGANVSLDGSDNITTGASGEYSFLTGTAGSHTVKEINPAGYRSTTPDQVNIDVTLGNTYYVNFGDTNNSATASVYGTVFDDIDGDGTQDPNEPGLAGANVSLDGSDNITTDTLGIFSFKTNVTGFHILREVNPAGYRSTTPDQVNISVIPGHSYRVDFGDTDNPLTSTIYGTVFNDYDTDGVQDANEPGLAGANVSLDGSDNITTDATGKYSLVTGTAGLHTVKEVDPDGYRSTTPEQIDRIVVLGHSYQVDFGDILDKPDISVDPASIDFGTVMVDSSSAPASVTISNHGGADLILGGLSLVGADVADFNIVSDNASSVTLPPGQSANVSVQFSPLTTGDKEAALQIPSNDEDESNVHVLLTGKASPKLQPDIEITPLSLNFPSIYAGRSGASKQVMIKNTGEADLIIGTLTLVGADPLDFRISGDGASGKTLAPGESVLVYVLFKPIDVGDKEAGLQIPSNDPDEGNEHVLLSGTGLGQPEASVSPRSIDFGEIVNTSSSAPQTVTIKNTGTGNLHIYHVTIQGQDNSRFIIVSNGASGKTLPPGGTATVSVRFTPKNSLGSFSARLVFSTDAYHPYALYTTLRGRGVIGPLPEAQISPYQINFGQVPVNSSSAPRTVSVKNIGEADLRVSSITFQGPDAGQFSFVNDQVSGRWIVPGASATFQVKFNPTAEGAKSARVRLVTNEYRHNIHYVYLSGNGGEVPLPAINVEPEEIDFGEIAVSSNSSTEYVIITNTGTAGLDIDQITLEGSDAVHFEIVEDNASLRTLEPGDFAVVGIQFKPLSAGFKYADLYIPSGDPVNGLVYVSLMGTGIGPNISVYPTDIDYGYIQVNTTSANATITVFNDGTETLNIGAITLTGDNPNQFEIAGDNASSRALAPLEWGDIIVNFKPTAIGLQESIVRIPSDDPDDNPVDVTLSGTGTEGPAAPEIDVSPLSLDFGEVDPWYLSATQNVTVSNTGSGNLDIGDIIINDSQFFITSGNISGQMLGPGASANISLVFSPLAIGAQSATMTIYSNDADESTVDVALTGTGAVSGTDLMITKTDSADPVNIGEDFTYTVTVTNNGPDDATGIYVYDYLPTGFDWQFLNAPPPLEVISTNATSGTVYPYDDTVLWDIGDLASGTDATMNVLVRVKLEAFVTASSVNNTAEVYGMEFDPDLTNNKVIESTTIRSTDLAITKTTDPETVNEGEPFTWTVTVTNNGPENATDVTVVDMYEYYFADISNITVSKGTTGNTAPDWMSGYGFSASSNSTFIFWNIGDLDMGATESMTITASANLSILEPYLNYFSLIGPVDPYYPVINYAIVLSPLGETDISNNYATAAAKVRLPLPVADLAITKSDNPDPAAPGGILTYTVNITNNGPEDVPNVYVLDIWENTKLALDSTTPSSGTANHTLPSWLSISLPSPDVQDFLFWDAGPLASGDSASLLMTTTVNATLSITENITNQAIVFGPAIDGVKENNVATEITSLAWSTDLAITKTDAPDPVLIGNTLTYTLTVTNNGPSNATGITVSDALPAGVVYQGVELQTGTYEYNEGTVTWQIESLAYGASASMLVRVTAPEIAGELTNTATVTGNETDPVLSNNAASATTLILADGLYPDISVTPLSVDFSTVYTGSSSAAHKVTVSNDGTADLHITGMSINNSQFKFSGDDLSGKTLAPGASAEIWLIFTPSATGLQSGTLTISSNDPDENPVDVGLSGTGYSQPGPPPPPPPPPTTTTTTPAPPPTTNVTMAGGKKYFTVDFLGLITREEASSAGRPLARIAAPDPTGTHLLEIEAGTGAKDSNRDTVTLVEIRETTTPVLPADTRIVGKAYEFMPSGTVFDQPVRLTLGYNVDELPENVTSVGTAYYTYGTGWTYLETEPGNVAELGKITAPVNHFTVFAVLAKVAEQPAVTPPPETTPVPPTGALPAGFKLSNLRIVPSVSRVFSKLVYFSTTGKEATISVDVINEGGQSGAYSVTLKLNDKDVDTKEITLGAGETQTVTFTVLTDKLGTYTVQIGELKGEFSRKLWINVWLWVGTVIVLGLLGWYIVYRVKHRDRAMMI
jgi:uncharacterized repeat protein (TIGR01451 family)